MPHHVTELVVAGALGGGRLLGTALLEALCEGTLEVVKGRFGRTQSRKLSGLEAEAERRRSAFWAETIARGGRDVRPPASDANRVPPRAGVSFAHRETAP